MFMASSWTIKCSLITLAFTLINQATFVTSLEISGTLLVAPYTGARGRTIIDYYLDADGGLFKLLDPLRLLGSFSQGSQIDVTGTPTMQRDQNAGTIPGISITAVQLMDSAVDPASIDNPASDIVQEISIPPTHDTFLPPTSGNTDPDSSSSQVADAAEQYPSPSSSSNPSPSPIADWGYNKTRRVVQQMSSIFYLVDFSCGLGGGAVASVTDFNNFLFNKSDSMSEYVGYCSLGKASFTPQNTLVVRITLPCKGTSNATGNAFDVGICDGNNLVETAYLADWTANNLKIKHKAFVHHILVYPKGLSSWARSTDDAGCSWAGKSVIGMAQGTWSYIWISGDFWRQQQLYYHEMGHNWDLGHSGSYQPTPPPSFDASAVTLSSAKWTDHGDWSDAMGYCCSKRCYNAPHNWQMGWSNGLLTLDSSNLIVGRPQVLTLQSQAISSQGFIAVVADWMQGGNSPNQSSTHTYFLSYRPKNSKNDVTVDGFNNGILLHIYDGKLQNAPLDTVFVGMVPSTSSFTKTFASQRSQSTDSYLSARSGASISDWMYKSGLVVTLLESNLTAVKVSICRRDPKMLSQAENTLEMCSDGLDNDCNGLVDSLDPACISLFANANATATANADPTTVDSPPSPTSPLLPPSPPRPPRARRPLPQAQEHQAPSLKRSLLADKAH